MDIDISTIQILNNQEIYKNTDAKRRSQSQTQFAGFSVHFNKKPTQKIKINQKIVNNYSLVLYSRSSCPYSQLVLRYIYENKITSITIKDIGTNPKYKSELLEIGGKPQVPCLLINGKPMYESKDIINWLKDNNAKY